MDRVFPPSISNGGREHEGMSLRDHFASLAMQGICANGGAWGDMHISEITTSAYKLADAMLKQRSL